MSALLRLRQEDHRFKASLEYTVRTYLKQTFKGLLYLEGVIKAESPAFFHTICNSFSSTSHKDHACLPSPKRDAPLSSILSPAFGQQARSQSLSQWLLCLFGNTA